jgi:hypothetical protein
MKIKMTLRVYLTPVRMVINKKKVLLRMQGKKEPLYSVDGNEN